MANWNVELFDYLVTYGMILIMFTGTVLAVAFGRKQWRAWVGKAQAFAMDDAEVQKLIELVNEPSDPPIFYGVKFLTAIGLKVSDEEVAQALPRLITAAVDGLKDSVELTGHVKSKLE